MDLAIYTYGYGDAMFNVLNGVKMVINTQFFRTLIQLFAASAVVFAAVQYAVSKGMNLTSKPIIIRILAIYFVINLLITPKVTVWVIDRVTKTKQNVDDLPFAFVPIGWLEQVGDLMSGAIEQAFSSVADDHTDEVMRGGTFNYRDYGLGFGAQLMKEVRGWRIQNPEFALNMSHFIKRCVMYEALIGNKYTVAELYASPNAWELIKTKAGGFTRVNLNINGRPENLTCYDAALELDKRYFVSEIELLKKKYHNSHMAQAAPEGEKKIAQGLFAKLAGGDVGKANRIFLKNIEQVHGNFLHSGGGANIIKQQLMLSALKTFHVSSSYGIVRAKMQQESTWATTGALAAEYLPIILTLVKCLMYAGLLFLLPMMVLAGGIARYQTYLLAVASLQLWPAMYSILNMFVEMYTSNSVFGAGNGILSYATYSEVGNSADKIAAIAGSLQIFIPFICFGIMQGSVGGFVHLAGNLTSGSQAAAGAAASEVVTGNRSLDNVSVGNMQMAMQSGFKTDFNQSYASGSSNFQHADGAIESVTANNTRVVNSAHMKDQGAVSLNLHQSAEKGLIHNLENAQSSLSSIQVAKKDAIEAQTASSVDYLSKVTEAKMAGKNINFDKGSAEDREFGQMVNQTESIAKDKGISIKEASEKVIKGGLSIPGVAKFASGLEAGVSASKTWNDSANIDESQKTGSDTQESTRRALNITNKVAESDNISNQAGIDQSATQAVTANRHEVQALEKSENQAKEDVTRYSTALNTHRSGGGSVTSDGNHLAINALKEKHNLSDKEAHDWFHAPQTAMQRSSRDQITNSLITQEMNRSMGSNNMEAKVQKFKSEHDSRHKNMAHGYEQGKKVINDQYDKSSEMVTVTANNQGFSKKDITNQVNKQEAALQEKNQGFQEQADEEIDKNRSKLRQQYQDRQENVAYKLLQDKPPIIMPSYRDKTLATDDKAKTNGTNKTKN